MDYRIEKKIQFSDETKYKNLYGWCLNEVESDGKLGEDLIPWAWSFYFIASSLSVVRRTELSNSYDKDEASRVVRETTRIVGTLYSGSCRDGEYLDDAVKFSMLGTDRVITSFGLNIYPIEEEKDEDCNLWACPSYETEIDFSNFIEDDAVIVNLYLAPKRFNEFVRLIGAKQVDLAEVRLSRVSGLYSGWSPMISTSKVKILTRDHVIEGLDGKEVQPQMIGAVDEFDITLRSVNDLKAKLKPEGETFYRQFEPEAYTEEEGSSLLGRFGLNQEPTNSNLNTEQQLAFYAKLVRGLKIPLWFIFIILVLILSK
jgi:hypothetical protein